MTVNSLWTDPGPVKVHSASPGGSPGPHVGNIWAFKEPRSGRGLHSDDHEWDDWKHNTLLVWQFDLKRSSKRLFPAIKWNSGVSSPTSSIGSRLPPEKWFRNCCSSSDTTRRLLIGVLYLLNSASWCIDPLMKASLWVQLTPLHILSLWEVRHWFILFWVDQVSSSSQTEIWILQTGLNPGANNPAWVLFFVLAVVSKQERDNHKTVRRKNGGIFLSQSLFAEEFKVFFLQTKSTHGGSDVDILVFFCVFLNKVIRIRQREEWRFCCVVSF